MTTLSKMHGRAIELISWPDNGNEHGRMINAPSHYADEMSLSIENFGDHGAAWVSVMKGGAEVARHNTKYIESIVWVDDIKGEKQ